MLNPIYIVVALIRLLILILGMILFVFPYILLSMLGFKHTSERAFTLRRWYIRFANFVLGIKIQVEGQALDTTALYVCNHRSFSDPLVLLRYLDAYVIAKAEVANMPIISTGATLTGIIYAQRENKDSRTAVRKALIDSLKTGLNVLVYPEGTTNPNKKLLEYRPGTFLEVARNNIPVVPVVLEYREEKDIWFNRGLLSQFFRQFGHLRSYTKLSIGPAFKDQDGIELRDQVQEWSQAKLDEMHEGWNSLFSDAG